MLSNHRQKKPFYFIDLFAGCGGMSLGVEAAGFESLGHLEIDDFARKTLELNFGKSPLKAIAASKGDVTKVNLKLLRNEIKNIGCSSLDLLVACPPCQGFSAAGRAKINSLTDGKRCFSKDPRNRLYKSVLQYVSTLKPKAVLFENVPGMLNVRGQNIVEVFCNELKVLGYEVQCTLLNSAWYGVPQSRERIIVMAFRKNLKLKPVFPEATHNLVNVGGAWGQPIKNGIKWENEDFFFMPERLTLKAHTKDQLGVSVRQAFADLPSYTQHLKPDYRASREKNQPAKYSSKIPPNSFCDKMRNWRGFESQLVEDHFCRSTPRDYPIFARMAPGDLFPEAFAIANARWESLKKQRAQNKIKVLPPKNRVVPPYRLDSFPEKWQKLDPRKLSCTVTAHLEKDGYSHIHFDNKQARTLTIREAARLQSFPDGYKFFGSMGRVYKQIGNAVPPLMSLEVAKVILKQLTLLDRSTTPFKTVSKTMQSKNSLFITDLR